MSMRSDQQEPDSWPLQDIEYPTANDCILQPEGSGHEGNKKFTINVEIMMDQVFRNGAAFELISQQLIDRWRSQHPPGRFLKRCQFNQSLWYDTGDDYVVKKLSQKLALVYDASSSSTLRSVFCQHRLKELPPPNENGGERRNAKRKQPTPAEVAAAAEVGEAMQEQAAHIASIQARVGYHLARGTENGPNNNESDSSLEANMMNRVSAPPLLHPAAGSTAVAMRPTVNVAIARTAGAPTAAAAAQPHLNTAVATVNNTSNILPSSPSNKNKNSNVNAFPLTNSNICHVSPAATSAKDDDETTTNILESTGSILKAAVEDMTKNLGILVMKYPSILAEDEMMEIQSTLLPGLSFLSDSMNHLADMQKHERQLTRGTEQQQQQQQHQQHQPQREQQEQQELQDVAVEHPDNSKGPGEVTTGKQQQRQQMHQQRDRLWQGHKRQLAVILQLDQQNDCLIYGGSSLRGEHDHPANKKVNSLLIKLYLILISSGTSYSLFNILYFYSLVTQSDRRKRGSLREFDFKPPEVEDGNSDSARLEIRRGAVS